MLEWVVDQHERTLRVTASSGRGIGRPSSNASTMAITRCIWHVVLAPDIVLEPNAGVSRAERQWLNSKYRTGKTAGVLWDEISGTSTTGTGEDTAGYIARALQPDTASVGTHWTVSS